MTLQTLEILFMLCSVVNPTKRKLTFICNPKLCIIEIKLGYSIVTKKNFILQTIKLNIKTWVKKIIVFGTVRKTVKI